MFNSIGRISRGTADGALKSKCEINVGNPHFTILLSWKDP